MRLSETRSFFRTVTRLRQRSNTSLALALEEIGDSGLSCELFS